MSCLQLLGYFLRGGISFPKMEKLCKGRIFYDIFILLPTIYKYWVQSPDESGFSHYYRRFPPI